MKLLNLKVATLLAAAALAAAACSRKKEAPKEGAGEPETFFAAVRAGQTQAVRDGLKEYPGLAEMKDPAGQWTALHLASNAEIAGALLGAGAPIDARGLGAMTPLHAAIAENRPEVAKLLLRRRASLGARTAASYTPLQLAVAKARPELAAILMELAEPAELAEPFGDQTLLHAAVRSGDATVAELLLLHGLGVDLRDKAGRTALFFATSTQMADLLLSRGAQLGVVAADGQPVLASLIGLKAEEVAARLLKSELPLSAAVVGKSLLAAVEAGSAPLTKLLLERRPDFEYKRAALFRAAELDHAPLAAMIAEEGAAQAQDARGRNALHAAATAKIVEVLGRHGIYADARDDAGRTPLFVAAAAGRGDVATALLLLGAEPGLMTNDGVTPLMMACARDDLPLAQALVEKGAEANMRDKHGITPLHYAAASGDLPLASVLLLKGADPLAKIDKKVSIPPARPGDPPNPLAGRDVSGLSPIDLSPRPEMTILLKKYIPEQ